MSVEVMFAHFKMRRTEAIDLLRFICLIVVTEKGCFFVCGNIEIVTKWTQRS